MAVLAACGRTRVLLLTEQRGKPALRRGHLSKDLEGERPEAMASTRRRKEHRAAEGRSTGRGRSWPGAQAGVCVGVGVQTLRRSTRGHTVAVTHPCGDLGSALETG